MAHKYLGTAFDIHGGGVDLIFPHHENEIAQSKASGDEFARYWVHNAWVTMSGEKMSKSLGNSVLVAEMVKHGARSCCATTWAPRTTAPSSSTARRRCARPRPPSAASRASSSAPPSWPGESRPPADGAGGFADAMDDDLGVPQALAVVHTTVRQGNAALAEGDKDRRRARSPRSGRCSASSASTRSTRAGPRRGRTGRGPARRGRRAGPARAEQRQAARGARTTRPRTRSATSCKRRGSSSRTPPRVRAGSSSPRLSPRPVRSRTVPLRPCRTAHCTTDGRQVPLRERHGRDRYVMAGNSQRRSRRMSEQEGRPGRQRRQAAPRPGGQGPHPARRDAQGPRQAARRAAPRPGRPRAGPARAAAAARAPRAGRRPQPGRRGAARGRPRDTPATSSSSSTTTSACARRPARGRARRHPPDGGPSPSWTG